MEVTRADPVEEVMHTLEFLSVIFNMDKICKIKSIFFLCTLPIPSPAPTAVPKPNQPSPAEAALHEPAQYLAQAYHSFQP